MGTFPLLLVGAALLLVVPDLVIDATWSLAGTSTDHRVTGALSAPPAPSVPRNVLVVGSDSRERYRNEAGDLFGEADILDGERADLVMLLQVGGRGQAARVLSIPRDLAVDVEGYGSQKLSTALEYGGPSLLVRTVETLTGLPVHHYVDLDFLGFAKLVDSVGGVGVELAAPARDTYSGLDVAAGRQRLDGWMAVALVRARNVEEQRDGAWVFVDDGDRGRIARQQHVVHALLDEMRTRWSPVTGVTSLRALGRHLRVDSRWTLGDVLELARALSAPGPLHLDTLPTVDAQTAEERVSPFPPEHVGASSYQRLVEPAASDLLASFVR